MEWFERLKKMDGRLALTRELEAECLAQFTAIPGDHVEIGCLWGGTALVAILAKKDLLLPGNVYTIDTMQGGWWDTQDPDVGKRPTYEAVISNMRKFGVSRRVHVVRAKSDPWPLPETVKPSTIFIDGDHRFEGVSLDWKNASQRATKFILLHDYNSKNHPGVQRMVDEIAKKDPNWRYIKTYNSIAVFERVG